MNGLFRMICDGRQRNLWETSGAVKPWGQPVFDTHTRLITARCEGEEACAERLL